MKDASMSLGIYFSADRRMQSSSERSGSDAVHTWPETQGYP